MKKIVLVLMLLMVAAFSAEAHRHRHMYRPVTISIQTFYDELSPYGDWIYTPEFGYVWRPYFDYPDAFRPYSSGGHWEYTMYGWTWVSDYRWGWATFHYGRWTFDDYLGWLWIPGYEWAPAWVTWGYYNDYYGWAPLGPNIYVNARMDWFAPDPWWTFVPCRHFYSHEWHRHIYDRPVHVTNIIQINNIYMNGNNGSNNGWYEGPRVNDVEHRGGVRVTPNRVVDIQRPVDVAQGKDELRFYRPDVEKKQNGFRPAEFRNAENVRSSSLVKQAPYTNDPGMNRTREDRIGTQPGNMGSRERTGTVPVEKRSDARPASPAGTDRGGVEPAGTRNRPETGTPTSRPGVNTGRVQTEREANPAAKQQRDIAPANRTGREVVPSEGVNRQSAGTRSEKPAGTLERPSVKQPESRPSPNVREPKPVERSASPAKTVKTSRTESNPAKPGRSVKENKTGTPSSEGRQQKSGIPGR